jgi:acyl carrier protein
VKRRSEIQAFIQDLLSRAGDHRVLTDQDSLFESGRLQSIDAVDLVVFLEERFGVDFSTIGFDRDRIDSIDAICTLAMIAQ